MTKTEEGYTHRGWMICRDSTGLWLLWPPDAPDGSRFQKAVGTLQQAKDHIARTRFAIRSKPNGTWLVGNGEWSDESAACQLFSSEVVAEAFARKHSISMFEIVPFEC